MSLKWAFNSATPMKLDWDQEFPFWERFPGKCVEPWYDKVKTALERGRTLAQLKRQMDDAGVKAIGMAYGLISSPSSESDVQKEMSELARRLDATAAFDAKSLTVVVLGKVGPDLAVEHAQLAPRLQQAADLAAQRKLRINLEFLGGLPLVGTMGSCIELIQAANHPALGMLFDLCHYYTSASHLEEIALLPPGKLFHVHVDDSAPVPMEKLRNDQRIFPGEGGRMNVPCILRRLLAATKYDGYLGVEIYDPNIWECDGEELFQRMLKSIAFVEERWNEDGHQSSGCRAGARAEAR